ncbi:MAG TPA: hypothetical protein VL021_10040 [Brumimicrobium sp.]|nr:hypothetical protein [Brumimicrobium sp.]
MKRIKQISLLCFLIVNSYFTINAQSPIMNEVKLKREWDNFRERDASVFKFNFSVSEKYFSKNTDGMIIRDISTASNPTDLSGYAKYAVLKATEEVLSKYSEKKIIVADPELAAKKSGGKIPGTKGNTFSGPGFVDFPNWSTKKFLKYDTEVQRIIEIKVEMNERAGRSILTNQLHYYRPDCLIVITIYNTDGKKIQSIRHRKRDFQELKKYRSGSRFFDTIVNTIWNKDIQSGAPIPHLVNFYLQTLEELLQTENINLE